MRFSMFMRFAVAVVAAFTAIAPATAQDTARPWAFLSPDANLTVAPKGALQLDLRANVPPQGLYLYAVNPDQGQPTVSFKVRLGGNLIGTADDEQLPAGSPSNPSVKKITLNAAPTKPGAAPANELPTSFTISTAAKGATDPANESLQSVRLRNPASLLGNTKAIFYGTENKLEVKISAADFDGPPCSVELAISPNDVPGLTKDELKGVTRAFLSADQREVTLFAKGLVNATGEGDFSLTVDGVEHAAVFHGNFHVAGDKDSGEFVKLSKPTLHIKAVPVARPGQDVEVLVSGSNIADNAKLGLTFGQENAGKRIATQSFKHVGAREQRVGAAIVDGNLMVTATSKAWTPHLDTRGIYGLCTLIATGTDIPDGKAEIILDDTPPKGEFVVEPGKPTTLERGHLLELQTSAEDPDSGIAKVEFFVGAEPPPASADGKPAESKAIIGVAVPPETAGGPVKYFAAKVQLPDSKAPVPVFARFTNGVGLTTVKKLDVQIVDPPAPVGSIKGQVFHGTILQRKLTVTLYNLKGEPVKNTTIDDNGDFEFKDIPPGDYKLGCEHAPRKLKGYNSVTVKADKKPSEVKLEIKQ